MNCCLIAVLAVSLQSYLLTLHICTIACNHCTASGIARIMTDGHSWGLAHVVSVRCLSCRKNSRAKDVLCTIACAANGTLAPVRQASLADDAILGDIRVYWTRSVLIPTKGPFHGRLRTSRNAIAHMVGIPLCVLDAVQRCF